MMARARDATQLALEELRSRLRNGWHVQGEQLVITDIASELHLSPTPVREAMARLAGEGLIEDRRGRGYFAWKVGATEILETYELHEVLAAAALGQAQVVSRGHVAQPMARIWPALSTGGELPVGDLAQVAAENGFDDIIGTSGNRALRAVYEGVRDRLAPIRRVEAAVLSNLPEELAELTHAIADATASLADLVARYHARRRDAAAALAWALRAQAEGARKE